MSPEVTIVDYGRGNLFSVCQAVARVGAKPSLTSDPDAVAGAARVILPGVGAFGDAMTGLRTRGLDEALRSFGRTGRPLLGICLGMQLLLDESMEFGRHAGLGLVPGRVERLPAPIAALREKIPNVGWCRLQPAAGGGSWGHSILERVKAGEFAYFVHSYAAEPADPRHRLANIDFGGRAVAAALAAGPIAGCQFHPEKSGEVGLTILDAFVHRG